MVTSYFSFSALSAHAAVISGFLCTAETRDKETGCCIVSDDYQACKQTYYLKQQNQIAQKNNAKFTDSASGCTTSTQEALDYCKQLFEKNSDNDKLVAELEKANELSSENPILIERIEGLQKENTTQSHNIKVQYVFIAGLAFGVLALATGLSILLIKFLHLRKSL